MFNIIFHDIDTDLYNEILSSPLFVEMFEEDSNLVCLFLGTADFDLIESVRAQLPARG